VPVGLSLPASEAASTATLQVNIGEVVSLNDPRFSAENGTLGFWQPYEFLTKLGWGIYFLQPYDAKKIPIVFVYGIDGSPQDWRSMIASLDKSKYQPWFFHYPSGIRQEKAANGLSRALQILRSRYGFSQLYVVAHSMGGLVSRGAVEQAIAESGTNFIPKFLTLCTPWGGDSEADGGVKHLKYPVPAWIDMEPGSKYLRSLFASKLPDGTRHFLIFDFQTHHAPWLKPDNDGVVQVASELFPPAQAEATAMFGFNYGHVETLGKSDVHAKVNEFLSR
jgi:pimeloyl-ACP methyl ester carboxylesterase